MKKMFLLFAALLFLHGFFYAQMSSDPSDPVYNDIRAWEAQGLISNLPLMRPYPVPVLKSLLEEVVQKGNAKQAAKAQEYYKVLTGRPIHLEVEGDASIRLDYAGNSIESLFGSVSAAGDISPFKYFSLGYELGVVANKNEQRLPTFQYSLYDISNDPVSVGPIEAFIDMNVLASVGTKNFYIQGGISRSSFGNFYEDSVVLNNETFHTGNFNIVLNQPKWMYTQSFFVLGATDHNGGNISANKFMAMHAITLTPVKWFNFTYYENIVYGDRFDPVYMLPFIPFMVGQSLGGYDDNLQMGIAFQFSPVKGLKWNTDILVDDISMNDIIKLKINTKIRIAAQTGLVWSPAEGLCKLLAVDYTMLVPYMYSHPQDFPETSGRGPRFFSSGGGINYQNYTTNGMSIGSKLPPNSDQISVSLTLNPVRGLDITLLGKMIRVANQNETISNDYAKMFLASPDGAFLTDGSVFNQYRAPDGNAMSNAQHKFDFMVQPTKMYVWQTGLEAAYSLPRYKWGTITVKFGYTFEYIKNFGVSSNIFVGRGSAANFKENGELKPESEWVDQNGNPLTVTDQDVADSIAAWKNAFKDIVNHYFRISVKFTY